jgi:hypothetical protein
MLAGEKPPLPVPQVHTEAGAQAFAEFFIKTIDWSYATTGSAYMRHVLPTQLHEFRRACRNIDSTSHAGNHYYGGRLRITSSATAASDGSSGAEVAVLVRLTVLPGT